MHQHLLVSDADHVRVEDESHPGRDRTDQPDEQLATSGGGVGCTALTLDAPALAGTDREAA